MTARNFSDAGPPDDPTVGCVLCGREAGDCECPECPVCGVAGDPKCYEGREPHMSRLPHNPDELDDCDLPEWGYFEEDE